ncbi:hypothetical protein GE21DRAFT_1290819 [Neurospora crassa]|nr:hypothetical protein GE21DRAFT_1290819 [Neurospora crassa]
MATRSSHRLGEKEKKKSEIAPISPRAGCRLPREAGDDAISPASQPTTARRMGPYLWRLCTAYLIL